MREKGFCAYHPLVLLLYFAGAIGVSVLATAPALFLCNLLASGSYYCILRGRKAIRTMGQMLPMVLFLMVINPVLNTRGEQILFRYFGRPYTLEALQYGIFMGLLFFAVFLWFGCYHQVMSSEKLHYLLGNLFPALSMLLVMTFRLLPNMTRKIKQIIHARESIGKGFGEQSSKKEKMLLGATVLGILASWSLEGSVVTGDSMRSRGYGVGRRTSFARYEFTWRDGIVFVGGIALLLLGWRCQQQMLRLLSHGAYLFLPVILHLKEEGRWHNFRFNN